VKGRQWHLAVNTAEPSPKDIIDPGKERPIAGSSLHAEARSVVVLLSR
jgi:glycogen operon protein